MLGMLELANILPVDVHTSLLSLGWGGVGVELWQSFEPHVEQPVQCETFLLFIGPETTFGMFNVFKAYLCQCCRRYLENTSTVRY